MTPKDYFDEVWHRADLFATLHAYVINNVAAVIQPDELLRAEWAMRVSCACRKSNTHIQMMESAKKWRGHNATNGVYCSRHRRVLVD
jgi:hypothetical protein